MNPYEATARVRKVEQLAFMAWGADIPAEIVDRFTEQQWGMLAQAAGVNKPGPATKLYVVDRLRELEQKAVAA